MVMSASVLATELLNLDPVDNEVDAITTLTDAYATFAADAVAGAQSLTAAGVALGKAAMITALTGVSVPNAGAAILVAATQAFWAAVAAGLATSFVGATAITPPPHSGLSAAFAVTFPANTSGALSKAAATSAVADDFYAQAIIGGTVTYPGPVVSPII